MRALVMHLTTGGIGGAIVDAFEYFIAIFEHNPQFRLILVDANRKILQSFIKTVENRYILDDLNWKKNLWVMPRSSLIRQNFEKVLVLDYNTIYHTRGLIKGEITVINELHLEDDEFPIETDDKPKLIVLSDKHTDKPEFMYSKKLYDVTYYGEMPFVYKDKEYRMKLLFDRFKPLRKVLPGLYINAPQCKDYSFIDEMKQLFPGKKIIHKSVTHLENLFEHFDTYVYYHVGQWYDPHPRLFLECEFYGKEIHYFNDTGWKDGSYYRYHDLMENGLKDRFLNGNDEVVQQFI
jgi:hypothetical protein